MKVFIDNEEYQGTPQEIHEFITLQEKSGQLVDCPESIPEATTPFIQDDFEPLEDIVNESVALRNKLAQDPAYNPYGGVVISKETVPDVDNRKPSFTAEEDTGVVLK
jgi:hypothetical protein